MVLGTLLIHVLQVNKITPVIPMPNWAAISHFPDTRAKTAAPCIVCSTCFAHIESDVGAAVGHKKVLRYRVHVRSFVERCRGRDELRHLRERRQQLID